MPRELPGLYWDDDKQRYFPLHARQLATVHKPVPDPVVNRPSTLLTSLSLLRSVLPTAHKDALIHQIRSSQILSTDKVTRSAIIPPDRLLSAFQLVRHGDSVWRFAGDTHGWFYSSAVDADHEQADAIDDEWQRQFHLSSEVPSICVSGTTCVATSFGPECRILHLSLDSPTEGIHVSRIDSRIVHDVWASDLQGSRLVLGANKQAVMIEDIAVCTSLQRLPTYSDVFALAQCQHLLYTGLRNGSILRFDTRVQRSNSYPLFHSTSQRTSSITGLRLLRDYQLVAGFIDGGISTFDLRFPISTPIMTFTGNFNSYTVRLPLVTDPYEKFLFSAGQDNRIRIWSLITGGPALSPGKTNQTVFQHPFEHRIAALQVIEDREGTCLWAASGTDLCKYSLGYHSGIEIQGG